MSKLAWPITILVMASGSVHTLYGQSSDPPNDQVMTNKNIFRRRVILKIVNDFVPFWGLGADDKGYTMGLFLSGRLPSPTFKHYIDISISSRLYTSSAGTPYLNASGLKIEPQYFTEISFLSIAYYKYLFQKKLFLCTNIGLGIYNEKTPIPGLALFFQGGEDGKGGFHKLLGKGHQRQDNVPTGEINANFYAQCSIKKFYFLSKHQYKDASYISVELGPQIVFPYWSGSQINCNIHSSIPIVRPKSTHKIKFRMAAQLNSNLSIHAQGMLFAPEIGVEFDLFFLRIGYTNLFLLGKQQEFYIKYSDADPLMSAYIQVTF